MKKLLLLLIFVSVFFISACTSQEEEEVMEPNVPEEIEEEEEEEIEEEAEPLYRSVFNGQGLEEESTYQAFGIIIENSTASRPHSGLGLADIVYENAVETYTITRFLGIFASEHPTKVGPVRSSRIPFVRMVQEWGLPYVHYGSAATGQGDARSLAQSINIPMRFDGHLGINDEFYFRDNSRRSPHNAYFNSEDALTMIPDLEYEEVFKFSKETNIDDNDITDISLDYATGNQVRYEYDKDANNYLRFINDEPMYDEYMDEQIRVTNIITLHAPHTSAEAVQYVLVDFIGGGKAEYFANGKYEEGRWRKDSYNDKTEYFDSKGNPIVLLPGNTWIQVVHDRVEIIID